MKTLFFKMPLCGVLISLLLISKTNAQYMVSGKEVDTTFNSSMNHVFGNLDKTQIPFGLLRDYAMEFVNLKNFNGAVLVDSNKLDKGLLRQIYKTLATARMTSAAYTTLSDPNIIDSLWRLARQPGRVTLCGLFYQYAYLASNADSSGKITVSSGQLFDKYVSGIWQNPYLTDKMVGFAPASGTYRGKSFNLFLPTNLWLTNSSSIVSYIEVDAGDGSGYRTLTPGSNLAVSYADTGVKTLNFKLHLNDASVFQSHSQLHVIPDPLTSFSVFETLTGSALNSHGVTAGSASNTYNITSTATYGGVAANGIISVQLAFGHTSLVKPLIVVEGFDLGIYLDPESPTGENTLSDFNKSVNKSLSSSLIDLLEDPTTAQYDIVYIDFSNGTDDIHRNALLVEDVIRWVNANKTGANQNVVLGQSMGGLCARYALKKMENGGETHDTRLFISHGTPEQGVVVPVGLQYFENHANNLWLQSGPISGIYSLIELFDPAVPNVPGLLKLTDVPAAQQMLINRVDDSYTIDNSVHNSWQAELDTLGYPSQGGIRNVAISNGSECGQSQTLTAGAQLVYLDGRLSTSFLADVFIDVTSFAVSFFQPSFIVGAIPGGNKLSFHFQANAAVNGGGNQVYTGNVTYTKTILWLIPVSTTLTSRTYNSPSGILAYETFAGDYFKIKPVSIPASVISAFSVSFALTPSFGYVPTPSALDIGSGSATLTGSDYLTTYSALSPPSSPKNSPFANFITAYSPITLTAPNNNEEHITYETRNGNWLAKELNSTPVTSGCDIFCTDASISGSATVCVTAGTYSVIGSTKARYSWSTTPNMVVVTGGTTASATIAASSSGYAAGTIYLTITDSTGSDNNCGTLVLQKDVTVGGPLNDYTVEQEDNTQQFCADSFGNWMTVSPSSITGVTYFQWGYTVVGSGSPPVVVNTAGSYTQDFTFSSAGTYEIYAREGNTCGLGATHTTIVYVTDDCGGGGFGGFGDFIVFPNPAGNSMTISTTAVSNTPTLTATKTSSTLSAGATPTAPKVKRAFSYKIYDKKGKILKQGSTKAGADALVDTHDLPSGTYFLHVLIGTQSIQKQIVIQH